MPPVLRPSVVHCLRLAMSVIGERGDQRVVYVEVNLKRRLLLNSKSKFRQRTLSCSICQCFGATRQHGKRDLTQVQQTMDRTFVDVTNKIPAPIITLQHS